MRLLLNSILLAITFNISCLNHIEAVYNSIRTLYGHTDSIASLIQLNETELATGSFDSTVKIWDLKREQISVNHLTLKGPIYARTIYALAKLNDQYIAAAAYKKIQIWSPLTGDLITTLTDHSNVVQSLVSLNETFFLSGSLDRTIRVWNILDWKCKQIIQTRRSVRKVLLLNASKQIAVANDDFVIRIYELNTGELKSELIGHSSYIRDLIPFNADQIVSVSDDMTMKLWTVNEGESLAKEVFRFDCTVMSLLNLNNGLIAVGLLRGERNLAILNTSAKDWWIQTYLNGHTSGVRVLGLLSNGGFASGSEDKTAIVWKE